MDLNVEEERYLRALEECVAELLRRTGKWFTFTQSDEVRIEHVGAHVLEFIHFVHAFPRWIAALLSRTPHYEIRRFLARNLYEEVVEDPSAGAPHYEFMIRLGEGAGLTPRSFGPDVAFLFVELLRARMERDEQRPLVRVPADPTYVQRLGVRHDFIPPPVDRGRHRVGDFVRQLRRAEERPAAEIQAGDVTI